MKIFKCNQIALGIACALAISSATDLRAANDSKVSIYIQAQPVNSALVELGKKTNSEIILRQGIDTSIKLPALQGEYSLQGALEFMLKDSGLVYEFISKDSILIKASDSAGQESEPSDSESVDEEIIVTGSRIARVSSQLAANVIVLDNAALLATGEATLEGALRQLPQNIFGATPLGAAVSGSGVSFNGALNITGASSINLRGLGSESTLILVDGHRIGKSGVFGGISDISGIPLRSIERVEIMLDGASSIYGSDAVGGVVNVITKKDFEGSEASYEYASSELGGFSENVLTITTNNAWDSGRILATFEHFRHSNLDSSERPEYITRNLGYSNPGRLSGSANFWRLGNEIFNLADLLSIYSFSEIFALINSGELVTQDAFLPPGQDGANLLRDDLIFADRVAFPPTNGNGISLLPEQVRNNLQLRFDQQLQLLGQEVSLSGSLYYSKRDVYAADGGFTFSGPLPADYPLNSLLGATMPWQTPQGTTVNWSLPGWADQHHETDEEVIRWNLSLDGEIGDQWRWNLSAGQSRSNMDSLYFNEFIGGTSDEYLQLLDEGLNILAGDLFVANSPELLQRLIAAPRDTATTNTESTFEFGVNGSVFDLPGGDVYLSLGGAWRQEGLETVSSKGIDQSSLDPRELGSTQGTSIPSREFDDVSVSRAQQSLFAELLLPLVGADNAIPGIKRLNLTGSARYDSYQRQGSDSTWALGMIWNPADQVTVKVNHSTSYVVPTFRSQLVPTRIIDYRQDSRFDPLLGLQRTVVDANNNPVGMDYIKIYISGGNPDLQPETASTFTAGIELTPEFLPGFSLSASWRQTEYKNRIGPTPSVDEYIYALGELVLVGDDYDTRYGRSLYRDDDGLLIRDNREVNTSLVETSGIDYLLSYRRDTSYGQFVARANINYTGKYNTVRNPGDLPVNQVDRVEFQSRAVIPAYRYSTQLLWDYRGFSASINASTASNTESVETVTGGLGTHTVQRITKPPLRMDLVVSYDTDEADLFSVPDWLRGTRISLKIPRLLNDVTEYTIIDLENGEQWTPELNANVADPIGRMFRISLTKRF